MQSSVKPMSTYWFDFYIVNQKKFLHSSCSIFTFCRWRSSVTALSSIVPHSNTPSLYVPEEPHKRQCQKVTGGVKHSSISSFVFSFFCFLKDIGDPLRIGLLCFCCFMNHRSYHGTCSSFLAHTFALFWDGCHGVCFFAFLLLISVSTERRKFEALMCAFLSKIFVFHTIIASFCEIKSDKWR